MSNYFNFLTFLTLALIFFGHVTCRSASKENYNGYSVFSVETNDVNLIEKLQTIVNVDTWKEPSPISKLRSATYTTDLMVSPNDVTKVTNFLESHDQKYEVKIDDVGSLIQKEKAWSSKYQSLRSGDLKIIDWSDYYTLSQIYEWLDEIVAQNSDIATIRVLGRSGEGREVKMVRISLQGSPSNKPAILVDGGIHAREWISPAVMTFIINDILTNREDNQEILEAVDLYLIPVLNVDGYEYTHTDDRMWRKTRSNLNDTVNGCVGVDGNRNFDFHFGDAGSSATKCSEAYHGLSPFSEPETAMIRDLVQDKEVNWIVYMTLHSYGQLFITPWGYTDDLPEDHDEMMEAAQIGADALKAVHGTEFRVGPAPYAAGCSDDYAKGVAGIKYVHTLELRGNPGGFILPADQIEPSGQETWAGIKALVMHVSSL